jgi:hypothetical protein
MSKIVGQLLVLSALVVYPAHAFSCSCVEPLENVAEDIAVSYKNADVVFLGKAEKVVRVPAQKETLEKEGYDPKLDDTTFKVLDSWKGVNTAHVVSRISTVCCLCGYKFEAGKTYLIYAEIKEGGTIYTSICNRTMPLALEQLSHSIDIRVLNRFLSR